MKTQLQIITTLILVAVFGTSGSSQNYKKLSDFPEHIKSTKPFKRFEWNYQQRAFPYDSIPLIYAGQVAAREIKKIRHIRDKGGSYINWIPKGPAFVDYTELRPCWDTVSGRVRALAVHPTDPLTVYIGAACGGLWKTTDGGENWLDIGHNLPSLSFGAIAIDPNNPETIYAGSGETMSGLWENLFGGLGMYKSTDGGLTWDTINDFGEYTVFTDIVVSPFNSDVLYASLALGPFNLGAFLPNEGVWKSMDAGNSWVKILDLPFAFDITLHPTDPYKIFACVGGMFTPTSGGIYVSTDQGNTWDTSNTGLPDPNIIDRLHLDISQSDPDILYTVISLWADTLVMGELTRVYKSINGGLSWFQISEGIPLGGYTGSGWSDQGWYDLCIAVDPLNSEHVFIGNIELHEATDGQNFSPVRYPGGANNTQSIAHCDYHQLKFAPSNPDYFYIGCDGGVYLSIDGCSTAMSRNVGLETLQLYRMGSHPTNPDIMIAGSQDNGTMRTIDGGKSWEVVYWGDGMECFFDYQDPDNVYASRQNGVLMRSQDGGQNFYNFGSIGGAWVTPFFIHPTGHDTLYSANDDIYRYPWEIEPFHQAWRVITSGLSPVLINTMAQNSIYPDHMILAGYNFSYYTPDISVMISTDGGYNWTDVKNNIPGDPRWISRVLCDPIDKNTMYIVRCGFSEGNKIYKTTDLGETWANISGDLPDIPCNTMFIDQENTYNIYIGTDLGVYLSEDGGTSYAYAGGDMPLVPIMDFDYVKIEDTSYLRVATHGRGIYETTNLQVGFSENRISNVIWTKASPNPFTVSTTIEYELVQPENVRITFYSQFGKQVDLIQQKQSVGAQRVVWTPNLPGGVYYFKLEAGEQVALGKVVQVR